MEHRDEMELQDLQYIDGGDSSKCPGRTEWALHYFDAYKRIEGLTAGYTRIGAVFGRQGTLYTRQEGANWTVVLHLPDFITPMGWEGGVVPGLTLLKTPWGYYSRSGVCYVEPSCTLP